MTLRYLNSARVAVTEKGMFIVYGDDVVQICGTDSSLRRMPESLREARDDALSQTSHTKETSPFLAQRMSQEETEAAMEASELKCGSDGCDSTNVQLVGGCPLCNDCGWSKC